MRKTILYIVLLSFMVPVYGQETEKVNREVASNYPLPKVDRRTELLSIVFRLAGNSEYNDEIYRSYVSDIHNHFDKYKEHPLIAFATDLCNKNGVGYDAVMFIAVCLDQPPSLNPVVPFTAKIPERRWGEENANKFVELLKQFYTEAGCEEFFSEHEGLYKIAQEKFMPVYESLDTGWYNRYYGSRPDGSLNVIIGLGLVETLGIYEKSRDKYPTLESFMPVLADFYGKVAKESEAMFEIKD